MVYHMYVISHGISHIWYITFIYIIYRVIYHVKYRFFSPDNLFHFKLDQERYSIKPEDFIRLPLFDEGNVQSSTYLNEFFFFVLSRFFQ